MTNYNKGVRYERDLMKMFKDNGYNVARTAGSHGTFDVIAWIDTHENRKVAFVAFVQAKVKKGKSFKKDPVPEQFGITQQ